MLFILFLVLLPLATPYFTNTSKDQYCISVRKPIPNYYWRKYEGIIPKDAVPGGHTPSGEITYIGQVLATGFSKDAILPGVIHVGKEEVEVPFYGVHRSKRYATILCSDTPSKLKWRHVNVHELGAVNEYMIVGGYEIYHPAYIGRVSYGNHLIVGKVLLGDVQCLRAPSPVDDKELTYKSFEILVFDPTG